MKEKGMARIWRVEENKGEGIDKAEEEEEKKKTG